MQGKRVIPSMAGKFREIMRLHDLFVTHDTMSPGEGKASNPEGSINLTTISGTALIRSNLAMARIDEQQKFFAYFRFWKHRHNVFTRSHFPHLASAGQS